MDNRVTLQPAYVLHRRPFQNSSLLIDFFTLDFGRVRAIAKGARSAKSRYRASLQLFSPILLSFSGRGEVKTVTGVESQLNPIVLQGDRLFSGMYVNELLIRLLHNHEEHAGLYKAYQQCLLAMQSERSIEAGLRGFEMSLLADLGYGLNLESDCETGLPIDASKEYRFTPDVGFSVEAMASSDAEADGQGEESDTVSGAHLLALKAMNFEDPACAKTAKRILRRALAEHLGGKPLASRALFAGRTRSQ